ncbi:hypothetical protein KCP78_06470 [Salmonella enterica subsp. enterica]|nr:hypothetical protein KCP78_06470 [Salmonella enterica subsp. enterica]
MIVIINYRTRGKATAGSLRTFAENCGKLNRDRLFIADVDFLELAGAVAFLKLKRPGFIVDIIVAAHHHLTVR